MELVGLYVEDLDDQENQMDHAFFQTRMVEEEGDHGVLTSHVEDKVATYSLFGPLLNSFDVFNHHVHMMRMNL
jgi:hypothetical protein